MFADHSELNPPDPIHFLSAAARRQQYLAKLKLSVKQFSVDANVGTLQWIVRTSPSF